MSLFMNKFVCLSSACLLNETKTKAQSWLIYKQINMNKLFIELSLNYSWSAWFIYNPTCFIDIVVVISPMLPFFWHFLIVSFFPSDGKAMGIYFNVVQQKDKKLIILTIITLDNCSYLIIMCLNMSQNC